MEVPISPAGLDTLLSRMTVALNRVEASQGSAVRGRRAELELLTELGHVRDFMRQAAQDTEHREAFHEIFDECSRVARVRVLCEEVRLSESNCADARLKGCLDSCKAVEAIVLQKGWARSRLRQAVARERELFVDDQSCSGGGAGEEELVRLVAQAAVAESEAAAAELVGELALALQKYRESRRCLRAAAQAAAEGSDDRCKLEERQAQLQARIQHLGALSAGEHVASAVAGQLEPMDLEVHRSARTRSLFATACAVLVCQRVARARALCEGTRAEASGGPDGRGASREAARAASCLGALDAVEGVLQDMGMQESLDAALEQERAVVEEALASRREEERRAGPTVELVAQAAAAHAAAADLARSGDADGAAEQLRQCRRSIMTAATVARAARKFKAAVAKRGEDGGKGVVAEPDGTGAKLTLAGDFDADMVRLQAFEKQVTRRLADLEAATEGRRGSVRRGDSGDFIFFDCEEECIQPQDLSVHPENGDRKMVLTACAALGAAGGLALLGPLGLVIGGAAAGLAAKSDTNTGDRLRGVGEKVVKVGGEAFESRKDTPVGQKAVDAGVEDGLAWTADKVDGVISSIYNVFKKVPADDDKKLDE